MEAIGGGVGRDLHELGDEVDRPPEDKDVLHPDLAGACEERPAERRSRNPGVGSEDLRSLRRNLNKGDLGGELRGGEPGSVGSKKDRNGRKR